MANLKFINFRQVSMFLTGNTESIRANKCPKKYQDKIQNLINLVDRWVAENKSIRVQRQPIRLHYDEGLYHFLGTIQFEIEGNEITDVTAQVEITQGDNDKYPEFAFWDIVCRDEFCNMIPCSNIGSLVKNLENSLDIIYR